MSLIVLGTKPGAPNGTVLTNIYSTNLVSLLTKSAEHTMHLYKCGIVQNSKPATIFTTKSCKKHIFYYYSKTTKDRYCA